MALSNTAVPTEYGQFREAVRSGLIPVNTNVSMQMNRIDQRILDPTKYYDSKAIEGFIRFCEAEMVLIDGDDVVVMDSFKLWAEDVLAWYHYVDSKVYNPKIRAYEVRTKKKRLTNIQYLIVGRGAAKTMYQAFMQAYFVVTDPQTTKQVVTAPRMAQADETMFPIKTAITRARGPFLKFMTMGEINSRTHSKVGIASTKKGIQNFMTNSIIEVRPMSIDALQGLRNKITSVDEWLSGEVKENVIGALEQGASKLDDYIIIATSSEGTARDGVGDSIKMDLQKVLRGEVEADYMSIWHYCLDYKDEYKHPHLWLKANPNLGISVSYEAYQRDADKIEYSPSEANDILAKRFGIPTEGLSYFFSFEETIPPLPHYESRYDGMVCSLGYDGSQGDDFCAFTFLFPLGNGYFGVKTRSYVAEVKTKKIPPAMVHRYKQFEQEGTLVVLEGVVLDMAEVYEDILAHIIKHDYSVMTLGYDPYNSEYLLKRWVADNGDYGLEIVRQGYRTESVPLGELKNLVYVDPEIRQQNPASSGLLLFDEELMKFAMSNSVVLQDNNGNLKLHKKRNSEKIDNVAALMDAWVAYTRNKEVFQ